MGEPNSEKAFVPSEPEKMPIKPGSDWHTARFDANLTRAFTVQRLDKICELLEAQNKAIAQLSKVAVVLAKDKVDQKGDGE